MSNQFIIEKSSRVSLKFTETPSKETIDQLRHAGFQWDGRSRQWFQSDNQAAILSESEIASAINQ